MVHIHVIKNKPTIYINGEEPNPLLNLEKAVAYCLLDKLKGGQFHSIDSIICIVFSNKKMKIICQCNVDCKYLFKRTFNKCFILKQFKNKKIYFKKWIS